MSGEAANSHPVSRLAVTGPQGGFILLFLAHLALTVLQSLRVPEILVGLTGPLRPEATDWIIAASEATLLAQVALIAAFVAVGSGRWMIRIIQGAVLLLWFELAQMAGTRWLDGGRDVLGFEEFLAQYLWIFAFLILPLIAYRLFAWRAIMLPSERDLKPRLQFGIVHLFWITTGAGALLGALRAFAGWNQDSWEQFRDALQRYPIEFASYDTVALTALSTIPAVLLALRLRSWKWAAVVLALWQLVLSVGFVVYRFLLPNLDPQFPFENPPLEVAQLWAWHWLAIAAFCGAGATVIWGTLTLVRWLGYEFLPLPRRGGGRQSSDATSAA